MFRATRHNFIAIILVYLFAASHSYATEVSYIGKIPGVKLLQGSCDPNADPQGGTNCKSQNINRDNFTVTVLFDPKQPTGMSPITIKVAGDATIPKTYTFTNASKSMATFSFNNCQAGAVDCHVLTTVYDDTNLPVSNTNYIYTTVGAPVKGVSNAGVTTSLFTAPELAKIPSSGPVKTAKVDSAGDVILTTKRDNTTGEPIEEPCNNCSPILDASGNPVTAANGLPIKVNVVYAAKCSTVNAIKKDAFGNVMSNTTSAPIHVPSSTVSGSSAPVQTSTSSPATTTDSVTTVGPCPAGLVIHNLNAVNTYAIGSQSCTIGQSESYTANGVVLSPDCEIVKDVNQCGTTASPANQNTVCDKAMIGGGDVYKADGSTQSSPGVQIKAVAGTDKTRTVPGSLFNLVFPTVDPDEIANFAPAEVTVSEAGSTIALRTHFELRYIGSKACVFAYGSDPSKEWRVTKNFPASLNDVYDVPNIPSAIPVDPLNQPTFRRADAVIANGDNCVPAPLPATINSLGWNNLVSEVCTKYDISSTRFRFPGTGIGDGSNRAFLGIVVECIENTLLNIFYPTAINPTAQQTFFSAMQLRIQNVVRGLMAMYIIFFGYKLVIGKKVPKREEWMWLALKLSLVVYFALGSGMTQLLPSMLNISKGLSVVLMEAGLGALPSEISATCASSPDPAACAASFQRNANESYSYCDFRDKAKFNYPDNKVYMKLWDMVDCKISKYLGVGDNALYPSAPQVLFVGVVSIFSGPLGIPIFIFSILFMAITIMIAIRVVHIYIMAFAGLVMLVFISPIVIPAVFFETTKDIFNQWISQLIAFWLQPVILFGFLAFMFAVIDGVMFGGNHTFETPQINSPAMKLINDTGKPIRGEYDENLIRTLCRSFGACQEDAHANLACEGTDSKCKDKKAAGYIYQSLSFGISNWPTDGFYIMNLWTMGGATMLLMIALGKLVLISFICFCLISSVENLSARLLGAMGMGAAGGMSGGTGFVGKMGPQQLLAGGVKGMQGANALSNKISPMRKANRDAAYKGATVVGGAIKAPFSAVASAYSNKFGEGKKKADIAKKAEEGFKEMKAKADASDVNNKAIAAQKMMQSSSDSVLSKQKGVNAQINAMNAPALSSKAQELMGPELKASADKIEKPAALTPPKPEAAGGAPRYQASADPYAKKANVMDQITRASRAEGGIQSNLKAAPRSGATGIKTTEGGDKTE